MDWRSRRCAGISELATADCFARFVAGGLIDEERLYRTGDRVRRRSDGRLDFLGRLDDQIKLRGYRIQLGEIEAALRSLPGVAKAAVAVQVSSALDQTLVGYAVAASGVELDPLQLRDALGWQLPEPMVPSRIMILGRLPFTAHGKLDRNGLAHLNFGRQIGSCAPSTKAEVLLARIWADALATANRSACTTISSSSADIPYWLRGSRFRYDANSKLM